MIEPEYKKDVHAILESSRKIINNIKKGGRLDEREDQED